MHDASFMTMNIHPHLHPPQHIWKIFLPQSRIKKPMQRPLFSYHLCRAKDVSIKKLSPGSWKHTPIQNACNALEPAAPSSYSSCIPTSTPLSSSSSPFCETPVWSVLRNPTACDRNAVFPARLMMPTVEARIRVVSLGCYDEDSGRHTLPALYWVTLCWVCFLHSFPLQ